MPCKTRGQYIINGYVFPQPDGGTPWERVMNGAKLTSGLPIYSPYRAHTWRFTSLPDEPYTSRLDALEGTDLTSLVTNSPDDADEFTAYDEAKILNVTKTHAWGNPRGVEVVFLVYVPS